MGWSKSYPLLSFLSSLLTTPPSLPPLSISFTPCNSSSPLLHYSLSSSRLHIANRGILRDALFKTRRWLTTETDSVISKLPKKRNVKCSRPALLNQKQRREVRNRMNRKNHTQELGVCPPFFNLISLSLLYPPSSSRCDGNRDTVGRFERWRDSHRRRGKS